MTGHWLGWIHDLFRVGGLGCGEGGGGGGSWPEIVVEQPGLVLPSDPCCHRVCW